MVHTVEDDATIRHATRPLPVHGSKKIAKKSSSVEESNESMLLDDNDIEGGEESSGIFAPSVKDRVRKDMDLRITEER